MAQAKKAFAFFLALAMFTFTFLNVSAQTLQTTEEPFICYGSTEEIQPRLSYFGTVSVGVSLKNGNVVGTGDYTSFANGIDVTFIIAIEKNPVRTGHRFIQQHGHTHQARVEIYFLLHIKTRPPAHTVPLQRLLH